MPGSGDHTFMYAFVAYRILGGIGVGLASMVSPMYIAEVAPADRRGNLVAWNQFAIIFGMLVVYFVNYTIALQGDAAWLNTIGWRWMFASEIIPALVLDVRAGDASLSRDAWAYGEGVGRLEPFDGSGGRWP